MSESEKKAQDISKPEYSGISELVNTENGLIGYSTSIIRKFYKNLKLSENSRILEFGAGTGFLAELFRSEYKINPICVELDPNLCETIKTKNFECFQTLSEVKGKFEYIYTSNVLEHIENDIEILIELRQTLNSKGLIAIYVPAHPVLFSTMDKTVGHVRRYTKRELVSKAKNAGFEVKKVQYDDFLGFFASLTVKIIGYNKGALGSTKSLQFYDKVIYPISAILDSVGFRKLLGKNLLLICQNPE